MGNVMFLKFTLEVAVIRTFFTKETSFVMRIHVMRKSAG